MAAISKRKLIGMSKYNLLGNWQMYISMGAAVAVNFIICIIISASSDGGNAGGSIDATMFGMAIALGAVMCATGLKFALVNGVSRKTYYISAVVSVVIAALVYSLIAYLLMLITHNIGGTNDIYYFLYSYGREGFNWTGMFFFEFGFMLFAIALGYFAAIVMYRTRRNGKIIILAAGVVLAAVMTLLGFYVNIWPAIGTFFLNILGFNAQNPFIAMATLIGVAAILLGGIFLIVRRADLRG